MFFKWCVAQNFLNLFVHKILKIYLFLLALPGIDTNFGTQCISFFQSYFQCWILKDNIVRHSYPCCTVANGKDSRRQGASLSAKQKWKGKWDIQELCALGNYVWEYSIQQSVRPMFSKSGFNIFQDSKFFLSEVSANERGLDKSLL